MFRPAYRSAAVNPTRREALIAMAATGGGLAPAAEKQTGGLRPPLAVSTFVVEVTPPMGHALMGGGIAPAKEVVDPLFAHGFVLRTPDKPVAFVAIDWCEIRNGAYDLFRSKIAAAV